MYFCQYSANQYLKLFLTFPRQIVAKKAPKTEKFYGLFEHIYVSKNGLNYRLGKDFWNIEFLFPIFVCLRT